MLNNSEKCVFHVHSRLSHDSWMSRSQILHAAKRLGIKTIYCCEHDKLSEHPNQLSGVNFVNGIEMTMEDDVHLILYNVTPCIITKLYGAQIRVRYSDLLMFLKNKRDEIIFSVPHPFRSNSGILSQPLTDSKLEILGFCSILEVVDGKKDVSQEQLEYLKSIFTCNSVHRVAAVDAHEPINFLANYNVINNGDIFRYKLKSASASQFRKKDVVLPQPLKKVPILIIKVLSFIKYKIRVVKFKQMNVKTLEYVSD